MRTTSFALQLRRPSARKKEKKKLLHQCLSQTRVSGMHRRTCRDITTRFLKSFKHRNSAHSNQNKTHRHCSKQHARCERVTTQQRKTLASLWMAAASTFNRRLRPRSASTLLRGRPVTPLHQQYEMHSESGRKRVSAQDNASSDVC